MENMSLVECIYEHIKDTFYYGLFGDFKLVIDKATGNFNATKLCEQGGKRFHDWSRLEKSKNMVEYYQKSWYKNSRGSFMYEVRLQNNDKLNKQVTGTYVPKELILDIASWISIEFYDKCNRIVVNYFVQEAQEKMEKLTLEKNKEIDELKVELQTNKEELEGTKEELEGTQNELKGTKEELQDTKEYALVLKEMMVKDDPITRTQVIYIATTELYAKSNNFKPGGVEACEKLKSRLCTYNTGRLKEDSFYYSDVFMVSNYHVIEAQLKNLLGRFKNKKEKEMYRLHYSDIRYIVEYLCKGDGEDVDEVNSKLATFISNLNKHNLRPIVPPPNTNYLTQITHLQADGTVQNTTIKSESKENFEEALKTYILTLSPETTSISKKKVFDDLKVKKDRLQKVSTLQALLNTLRPEIKLLRLSKP
jgi:hypothetical protein